MDHRIYVKHDSDNCECCLDFWLGPQPQAREKEILESDADSGYCSITQTKELSIVRAPSLSYLSLPGHVKRGVTLLTSTRRPPIQMRIQLYTTTPLTRITHQPSIPIIPRIIVTPLSDEEQIEHNACIRAALIQRNAFTCTITSPSTTSLTALSNEEKALPPASASGSTTSLATFQSTASRPSLTPPQESWSHRLKDTYENRMTWPQYFNIPTPHTSSLSSSFPSTPSPTSSTSIFSSTLAAPHLRKRASKDAIELHPRVLAPVSTSRGQSLRKRWSIAGSGVGFGFGTTPTASTARSPRVKVDSNPTPPRGARPSNPSGRLSNATNPSSTKSPNAPTTISSAASDSALTSTSTLKRRSRVTSTQSLNDKPFSSSVASSPSSSTSSLALSSQPSQTGGSGGGPGGALGRWGRALNSATGGVNGGVNGSGGGGAFGKSMRSLKTLYSNAPSSFRML